MWIFSPPSTTVATAPNRARAVSMQWMGQYISMPVAPVVKNSATHRFRYAANCCGNHKPPLGKRLGDHHAVCFTPGGEHQHVSRWIADGQFRSLKCAGEIHRFRNSTPN